MTRLVVRGVISAVLGGLIPTAVSAHTPLKPERKIEAKGFKTLKCGKEELKAAHDSSGIACLPPSGSEKRSCLIVNDQDNFAQLATLANGTLRAGEIVPLLSEEREDEILGRKPKHLNCSGGR